MAHPATAQEMKDAIEGQESKIDLAELQDLLGAVQEDIEDHWEEHMASVEEGELTLVAENEDALVFADENGEFWQDQFDSITDYINLLGTVDEGTPETILAAHHNAGIG